MYCSELFLLNVIEFRLNPKSCISNIYYENSLLKLQFAHQKKWVWPIWSPVPQIFWLCDYTCCSLQRVEIGIILLPKEVLSKCSHISSGFISRHLWPLRDLGASGRSYGLLFLKVKMHCSFLVKNEFWHCAQVYSSEKGI